MSHVNGALSFLLNDSLYLSFLSVSGFGTSYQNIHGSIIQIKIDFALDIGDDD